MSTIEFNSVLIHVKLMSFGALVHVCSIAFRMIEWIIALSVCLGAMAKLVCAFSDGFTYKIGILLVLSKLQKQVCIFSQSKCIYIFSGYGELEYRITRGYVLRPVIEVYSFAFYFFVFGTQI